MRANQRRVILYGNSLVLEGLRASLETCPDLEVITLDPACVSLQQVITARCPAALVFDSAALQPDFPTSLLEQADLLLIGINPETHQALVWSGRHAAAVVAGDLLKVLRQEDPEISGEAISQAMGKEDHRIASNEPPGLLDIAPPNIPASIKGD